MLPNEVRPTQKLKNMDIQYSVNMYEAPDWLVGWLGEVGINCLENSKSLWTQLNNEMKYCMRVLFCQIHPALWDFRYKGSPPSRLEDEFEEW